MENLSYFRVPQTHERIYEKIIEQLSRPDECNSYQSIIGKDILFEIDKNNIGVGKIGSMTFSTCKDVHSIKIRFSTPIEWLDKDQDSYKSWLIKAIIVTINEEGILKVEQISDKNY